MAEIKKIEKVKTVVIDGMMGGPEGNTIEFRGYNDELLHKEVGIDDFSAKSANVLMMDTAMIAFKPTTVCTIRKHSVGALPAFKSVKCGPEALPKTQRTLTTNPQKTLDDNWRRAF